MPRNFHYTGHPLISGSCSTLETYQHGGPQMLWKHNDYSCTSQCSEQKLDFPLLTQNIAKKMFNSAAVIGHAQWHSDHIPEGFN